MTEPPHVPSDSPHPLPGAPAGIDADAVNDDTVLAAAVVAPASGAHSSSVDPDPYRLRRFADAQRPVLEAVDAELSAGAKRSHWMWYVFPQIQGLGRSAIAREFAIESLDEARAYLADAVLGPRLRAWTLKVMAIEGRTAHQIFGSPDDMKFRSSMTLFALATDDRQIFLDALGKYFNADFDQATLDRLV
jgi:uncharacterized protein (DUF1810 family)